MNAVLWEPVSERFREADTPFLSAERLGAFFGFQVQEVADRARVHRNTLRARPHTGALQNYLKNLVRVLHVATEMTGDPQRAAFLIRNEPLRAFGHKTADTLIAEGRADDVVAYLESLASGAAG